MSTISEPPLTPEEVSGIDFLRTLAITRGIALYPVTPETSRAALLASRLWCAVTGASSLELSARYGPPANESASTILHLAAGHPLKSQALTYDIPRYSRQALLKAEATLREVVPTITPRSRALASAALSIASYDTRFAAALDVLAP